MKRPASGDWQRLRARLEATRAAMEKLWAPGEAQVREVLRARAERLARLETGAPADREEVLVFRVGGERYCLEMRRLAAVVLAPHCARVPGSGDRLAGVIQVRGEVRAVWDLRRVLGVPPVEASPGPDCVLLIRQDDREFGLRVDAVEETRYVRRDELRPAPDNSRHATGVTPDLVAMLNLDMILKDEEAE